VAPTMGPTRRWGLSTTHPCTTARRLDGSSITARVAPGECGLTQVPPFFGDEESGCNFLLLSYFVKDHGQVSNLVDKAFLLMSSKHFLLCRSSYELL